MDELRFKALMQAYGADVERWPLAERAAGRRRLETAGAEERAQLREAVALDSLLAEGRRAQQPSAALVGRVMERAPGGSRAAHGAPAAGALAWFAPQARLSAACLALVMVGAMAGWSTGGGAAASAAGDAVLEAAYDDAADDLFAVEDL